MQDVIGSLLMCALTGYALSLVVATILSQWTGRLSVWGIAGALLLAMGPLYLSVSYVIFEGAGSIAAAIASFAFGLYCMRGWWSRRHMPVAGGLGARLHPIARRLHFPARSPVAASPELRQRTLSVVQSDRQQQRPARNTTFADAA